MIVIIVAVLLFLLQHQLSLSWTSSKISSNQINQIYRARHFIGKSLPLSAGKNGGELQFQPEDLKGLVDVGSDAPAADDEIGVSVSDKSAIMDVIIQIAEHYSREKSMENLNPSILTENAHILCRGRFYEEVMTGLLDHAANEKVTINLQRIDALIRGFVTSERKSRSRLKVNYLLAAASESKFEDAMEALSASDEVDDELQSFVRSLIKKEENRLGGLESVLNEKNELVYDPSTSSKSGQPTSQAMTVLKMIYKRVKAELLTKQNVNLKLLNALLRCTGVQRYMLLESRIRRLEQLMEFSDYVQEALDFVEENDGKGAQGTERVQLGPDMIEMMRDVMRDIKELQKRLKMGGKDGVVYERLHDP